jgi:hypothetical protein
MFQTKVTDKIQNTHLRPINCFQIMPFMTMWKNSEEPDTSQMSIWCMRIAYWIPTATNTDAECGTLIAFPLQ